MMPEHERTLGDTFEESVVIESGRDPAELRFATGPGTTGGLGPVHACGAGQVGRGRDAVPRVRRDQRSAHRTRRGGDHGRRTRPRGTNLLLQIFDIVTTRIRPAAVDPADRQYERAFTEIGRSTSTNPRDLARILDATTSPDAAYPPRARSPSSKPPIRWSCRSRGRVRSRTRRAAVRRAGDPGDGTRGATATCARCSNAALDDKDACVRYYALRGIAADRRRPRPTRASSAASETTTSASASPPKPRSRAAPPNNPSASHGL